jgi:lactoylglutathione lyase
MKLTHTRILVNNYKECYQFYKDVLSFTCTWGDENSNYAQFDTGNTYLSIFDKKQMLEDIHDTQQTKNSSPLNEVAIIFGVDDVEATYDSLKSKVDFITEPHNREDWGIRVAHFRDPNGTLIEINHRI